MFNPFQNQPYQKTSLVNDAIIVTADTTSSSDEMIDYDSIILESFKEALTIHKLLHDSISVGEVLVNLAVSIQPHLFFAAKTQAVLESNIFSDKELRDFIYSLLARLKYNCQLSGGHIDNIVDFIAATGVDAGKLQSHTKNADVSPTQKLFNDAYVTSLEDRLALLECYEWGIIVFLSNMYIVPLCSIMREINTDEKLSVR